MSFVMTGGLSVRGHKNYFKDWSHELTASLSIFNLFKLNELWPYYQEQIILNCTFL